MSTDYSPAEPNAFERETTYRLFVEAVRHWLISTFLSTKKLPTSAVFFVYGRGPASMDWGEPMGVNPENRPMAGKRIRVTVEVEDYDPLSGR